MENYTYPSYPDSGESSPRSREVDFENPPPWDDPQQPPPNYKAKFMCSYGGKIQPRSHDNQLSYVGGETKILAVDLNIKFSSMISKLSALCDGADVTFKYQLPGEELDALISVTNDDDLEHMMHEYDRLYRASAKPARMRLFLFPANSSQPSSFASDRDGFVETLNSGPGQPDPVKPAPAAAGANVDYLFGLEKGVAPPPQPPPPVAAKFHDAVPGPAVPPMEYQVRSGSDRVIGSDPAVNPVEVQRQFQRMQIGDHQDQAVYRRKSEDNSTGGYAAAGDYYVQKFADKAPAPSNLPAGGYWPPEKQVHGEGFPPMTASNGSGGTDQPVYMIPQPGTFYHAPPQMARPPAAVAAPATQGYYAVQRMVSDGYREQQVYSAAPRAPFSSGPPASLAPAAQPVKSAAAAYTDGFNVVRQGGMPENSAAYAQVAYDSSGGRQFYYTAPAGVVHQPPYQGVVPTVGGDVRPTGVSLGQDLKVVNKVSQG